MLTLNREFEVCGTIYYLNVEFECWPVKLCKEITIVRRTILCIHFIVDTYPIYATVHTKQCLI